jgi:hypothetical protein
MPQAFSVRAYSSLTNLLHESGELRNGLRSKKPSCVSLFVFLLKSLSLKNSERN